ncbi:hypothetical protein CEXT_166641 [Caerostris extrusa]|uniref:Transmembrane protein n=1 Tax=Caerostris extrusa TaxID=172846 RepID=A0AAV4SVD7_CAEEX|nr:hypothetical protein CEXT_166641 [Caerostris extrusa]
MRRRNCALTNSRSAAISFPPKRAGFIFPRSRSENLQVGEPVAVSRSPETKRLFLSKLPPQIFSPLFLIPSLPSISIFYFFFFFFPDFYTLSPPPTHLPCGFGGSNPYSRAFPPFPWGAEYLFLFRREGGEGFRQTKVARAKETEGECGVFENATSGTFIVCRFNKGTSGILTGLKSSG